MSGGGMATCGVTVGSRPHAAGVGPSEKSLGEMTAPPAAAARAAAPPPLTTQPCQRLRYSPSRLTLEWGGSCS